MAKNIALFTYTLLSGGAEKQLVLLANTYSNIHKVTIFIYYPDKTDERMVELFNNNKNLSIVKLKGTIFNKSIVLKKELKQRKIEYFFSYLTFPNLFGSIIARISDVDFIYSGVRSAYLPRNKWFIECLVNRYIADYTIFNNYKGEINSRLFGLNRKKNIVISNCLDKPVKVELTNKNKSVPTIITIGRFVKEKDFKTALEVIKVLKERGLKFRYVIIGYGKLEFEIRELIKEFSLEKVVEIIISPLNVYSYLLQSDIYLSTSLFEGTSNSILEAMNSNLPIVTTNVGDNCYLIEEGYNGYLLDKMDIDGISRKLELLIIDKSLRDNIGKNNKDVIERKFSVRIFERKYFELLRVKK